MQTVEQEQATAYSTLFLHIFLLQQEAYRSSIKDFEDALQYFSATESDCEIVITRNGKDFKKSLIPVMTADEFLNSLNGF